MSNHPLNKDAICTAGHAQVKTVDANPLQQIRPNLGDPAVG